MPEDPVLLDVAGLSPAAEQVYLFVVHRGRTVPGDVAERFGLDVPDAAALLDDLLAIGLVARYRGDADAYSAVDPRISLGALADLASARSRSIRQRIPALSEQFERTVVNETGSAQTRVLATPGEIAGWYVRLQHQAKRELLVFDRPPYFASHLEPVETTMMARGVVWRGIYTPESFEGENAWDEVVRLAEMGEQGRIVPQLPIKLAMVDGVIALVSLSLDGVRADTLVTESEPLLQLLHEMFEVYWARAIPLSPQAVAPPAVEEQGAYDEPPARSAKRTGRPTTEQQGILAMIGAGMTDEAIAVRLGLSVRSLRRRSQRLMADLGAENRFQLGAEAARRGWI
jgi:DNA-binding CsgD family transcriptional regulator